MPYVARDDQGRIIAVEEHATAAAAEAVALDDPGLLAFLNDRSPGPPALADVQAELEATDLELIRVIEDVITVLIDKRIFNLTDLPVAAQQKLARRYTLRSKLTDLGGIIGESEDIMLP